MRKLQFIIGGSVVAVAIVLVLAILAVRPKHVAAPSSQAAATQQASQNGTVKEDLTFSGAVSGHMTVGRRGEAYLCSPSATGPIVGNVNGADYTFEYRAMTAKGPGTYPAYVQIGPLANRDLFYGADAASLTINNDSRSGSVTAELHNLQNSAQVVHLNGTWTCPPDF